MARVLGYEAKKEEARPETEPTGDDSEAGLPQWSAGPDHEVAPVPFWRLEEIEFRDSEPVTEPAPEPPSSSEPIGPEGLGRLAGEPPRPVPLVSSARLWPVLRQRLSSSVPSRVVDVEALADLWSRGREVRHVPFRPLAAWAPRITVLVDRSLRSIPFWDDQGHWLRQLRRHLGRASLREVTRVEGYSLLWRDGRHRYRHLPVRAEEPVLALSDLGFLAASPVREDWWSLGQELRRSGVRCHALVACPRGRWDTRLANLWSAVEWEQPRRTSRSFQELDEPALRDRCERLLVLLSFAARVEPALLRAIRRLLPATDADVATEADVWHHPAMGAGFSKSVSLSAEARREFQPRFAALPDELKCRVVATLRAQRAGQPVERWLDEVLALDTAARLPEGALQPDEMEAARSLWSRVAETLGGALEPSRRVAAALKRYTVHAIRNRQPKAVWGEASLASHLWRAWSAAWDGEGDPPLPRGVYPEVWGESGQSVRRWQLRQVGASLRPVLEAGQMAPGSPVLEVESANDRLGWRPRGAPLAAPYPIEEEAELPLPAATALRLETDRTSALIRRLERPGWATAIGRDRFGLWTAFEVEGVEQRLRWIPPGRFWMGSPEGEAGRWEDEGPRHLVTLSRGYWLADTACTQQLWEVVMGENPSRFQSPSRPVEQVSWEDCQTFLATLNRRVEGLDVRLPTEAEWEYGCRSGTETATYAGDLEIRGAHDAPVLDAIAWYGGNSGEKFDLEDGVDSSEWPEKQYPHRRAGTHPVAQKEANRWGLYDSLGNVEEWCSDWFGSYEGEEVVDPQGPETGSGRVIRGGSWSARARGVRAAFRLRYGPSIRWNSLGFRLARGPSALQSRAEPKNAERSGEARRE